MKVYLLILGAALGTPWILAAQSNGASGNAKNGSKASAQLSAKGQQFLSKIASEDQSEINLAMLALQKTKNNQVKTYARTEILAADAPMEQGAKVIAEKYKAAITVKPSESDTNEYNRLSGLSGKAFNQAYMKYESSQQAKDLQLVGREETAARNRKLRNYVRYEYLPVTSATQSARELSKSIG
jgi:predicted outer membrane protein